MKLKLSVYRLQDQYDSDNYIYRMKYAHLCAIYLQRKTYDKMMKEHEAEIGEVNASILIIEPEPTDGKHKTFLCFEKNKVKYQYRIQNSEGIKLTNHGVESTRLKAKHYNSINKNSIK